MRCSLFIVAFVAGAVGGCFLRPSPPPGFRYSCAADTDCLALDCMGNTISRELAAELIVGCDDPTVLADPTKGVAFRQTCLGGLCEYPCSIFTIEKDCPISEGFQFCFNGVCTTACGAGDPATFDFESNDEFCTAPQTCVPLGEDGIDLSQFGALAGPLSEAYRRLPEGAGFCGIRCDARGAAPCPPGEACTGAMCIPNCGDPNATPCAAGSVCLALAGFSSCLPTCDPGQPDACGTGQVCVPGVGVCQPSCVGTDAVECPSPLYCDPDLSICVPPGDSTT